MNVINTNSNTGKIGRSYKQDLGGHERAYRYCFFLQTQYPVASPAQKSGRSEQLFFAGEQLKVTINMHGTTPPPPPIYIKQFSSDLRNS